MSTSSTADIARDIAKELRVERFSVDVRDSNRDGWQDLVVDARFAVTIDPRVWLKKITGAFLGR